jgi:hypothetical protein
MSNVINTLFLVILIYYIANKHILNYLVVLFITETKIIFKFKISLFGNSVDFN